MKNDIVQRPLRQDASVAAPGARERWRGHHPCESRKAVRQASATGIRGGTGSHARPP